MHDRNGTELRVGDVVLVPARVVVIHPTDDFCNLELETVHGRRPDGSKEHIYAVNTAVVVLHERPPSE